jgi:hypothetical protein
MRFSLSSSICLASLLIVTNISFAQAKDRVDIILQGPWILYKDSNFQDSHHNATVALIVMTPEMSDIDSQYRHKPPTIGSGDGYSIPKSGIYCLDFGDLCAPKNPNGTMTTGDYPDPVPLPVQVPAQSPDKWPWYKNSTTSRQANGIYLILPMPDSFSNDGTWPMQFAAQSDYDNPKTPVMYGPWNGPEHSIGLQLHYTSIKAATFSVMGCASPLPSDDSSTCTIKMQTHPLLNKGALRITMKAPDMDDSCDPHVRAAYRRMLLLLDSTPLDNPTGTNVNQSIAFIDPARDVDDNNQGVYDDPDRCRAQYDPPNTRTAKAKTHEAKMLHEGESIYEEAFDIVKEVNGALERNPCTEEKDPYLLCAIKKVGDRLNPQLPNIAQFNFLADLIKTSEEKLRNSHNPPDLQKLRADEQAFILNNKDKTKGAKDCLASIMMVKQ